MPRHKLTPEDRVKGGKLSKRPPNAERLYREQLSSVFLEDLARLLQHYAAMSYAEFITLFDDESLADKSLVEVTLMNMIRKAMEAGDFTAIENLLRRLIGNSIQVINLKSSSSDFSQTQAFSPELAQELKQRLIQYAEAKHKEIDVTPAKKSK